MTGILLSAALSTLAGCGKKPLQAPLEPDHIEGGTTTRVDEKAPKEISSKELTGFSVNLFLESRWYGDEEHFFDFSVAADADGTLIASEKNTAVSAPADETLLTALQQIIDTHKLAGMNGLYEVTAGLPPEFQECYFSADYASGERLHFTVNNDPSADWAVDIYDAFSAWFSDRGIDTLYPEKETSKITRIELTKQENGTFYDYGGIRVLEEDAINGERYLFQKRIYDASDDSKNEDHNILFPADFYDRITEIIGDTDLIRQYDFSYYDHSDGYYGMGEKPADEADMPDTGLELYLEFESGRHVNIDTKKASELKALSPVTDALIRYYESLFS
jgi:predicted small lipoprotein YifL